MVFDFGRRLRQLREEKKLTQTKVARRMNLSKATISGYENNVKTPSVDVLAQLSVFYGVTTDYLLGLDNRPMLYTDGLSDTQRGLIQRLIEEFRADRAAERGEKRAEPGAKP